MVSKETETLIVFAVWMVKNKTFYAEKKIQLDSFKNKVLFKEICSI